MKLTSKPSPYVILLGLLFASHMVASRFSLGQFAPLTFVSLRFIIAAVCHILLYFFLPNRKFPTSPRLWLHAGIMGILGTAIPITCFVNALQYQSSGIVSLLATLNTPITILLAHYFLEDEKWSWNKLVGSFIAFGGAALLLITGETGLKEIPLADWHGYLWTGIAICGIVAAPIYARLFLRTADNFNVAGIRMITAALISLPVTILFAGYDLTRVVWSGYATLLYSGLVPTFLAFFFEFYIIKRFGATIVSQSSYYVPVFATILGVLLLGEIVTPIMLVGMVIIFAGIALLGWKPKKSLAICAS